jgi:hypothetical protein
MLMDPSVIAYETELTALIRRYLAGELAFKELAHWVNYHELSWAEFEFGSLAAQLSGSVLLTLWEDQNGDHTPESIHERIAEDFAEIVGSRALP